MTSTPLRGVPGTQGAQGRALLGNWSTAPGRLKARLTAIVLALAAFAGVAWWAQGLFGTVAQTIGKDAVPSIVAAERIRTVMADAHTQFLNVFLAGEPASGPSTQAHAKSMAAVQEALLTAAQNITYGDEERQPILTMMKGLAQYEHLAGAALADRSDKSSLLKADELMRDQLLPAAKALDDANFKHLAETYGEQQRGYRLRLAALVISGLAVLVACVYAQARLAQEFRRLVNPALAASTLIFLAGLVMACVKASAFMGDIKVAKQDAFDSVHALSQAEALAYIANAYESLYLLEGSKPRQDALTQQFGVTAKAVFSEGSVSEKDLSDGSRFAGRGLLGDELANVTFEGEAPLARAELLQWLEYMAIDGNIRDLERQGRHAEAVALCLGSHPHESDWAFEQFIHTLDQNLQLNLTAFDAAIERANNHLATLRMLLVVIVSVSVLGAVFGIRQRLTEFRA